MAIRLLKYNFTIKYIPGKEMIVADVLSRNYCKEDEVTEIEDLNEVVHTLNISDERKKLFQEKTLEDVVLKELRKVLLDGWPNEKEKLKEVIKPFWKFRNNLFICDDLIFVNEKLLVPLSLRKYVLQLLHQPHLGIEKTKARARTLVYWPGINECIEEIISKCEICQKYKPSKPRESLLPHNIPDYPFFKVGVDVFEIKRKNYLVIVDYYSRYLEIVSLVKKTANEIIKKLKEIFASHGIPREIVGDNMPFNSYEFKQFGQKYDIKIITSSPHYPRSNGLAEKYVHIAKNLTRKAQDSNEELWLSLLEYRNTPLKSSNLSPVEMLMGRKTRTLLPGKEEVFKAKVDSRIVQERHKTVNYRTKKFYDMHTRPADNFATDDLVWVKDGKIWKKGKIKGRHTAPRSYFVELENGTIYRRNTSVLKKRI